MARKYNGKQRVFKKTFGEKCIDRAMNDGEVRSSKQVIDAIITYMQN
jgi:hypothetical protein